jgi:hypothetical protein
LRAVSSLEIVQSGETAQLLDYGHLDHHDGALARERWYEALVESTETLLRDSFLEAID